MEFARRVADVNFSPAECVCKEILEESGIKAKVIKLVAFLDKLKHSHPYQIPHTYKAFFLCERISGKCQPGLEIEDVDFFELDKLPPLSLDRVVLEQIKMVFNHKNHIQLATEFD